MFKIGNNCQCLIEALRCLLWFALLWISAYLVCKLDVCARNPKQSKHGHAYTKNEENVNIQQKRRASRRKR